MARQAKQASSAAAAAGPAGLIVGRERLFARLDELAGRAVWLQGPTGAGKTVLLRTYTGRGSAPTLWIPIDTATTSADAFFDAFVQGAERAGIADLPHFAGEHRKAPADLVRLYAQRIAQRKPGAFVVIDDAHRLLPAFAGFLGPLVDACCADLRLFLAGQDWPLGLESHIAAAKLVVIGHEQLAFDEHESLELAQRVGAGAELAKAMRETTSGWAAGLMLALQLGQGGAAHVAQRRLQGPLASLVQSGVLSGIDPATARALAALSPARRIPSGLANAGAPWSAAVAELERLSERGLFVEREEGGDLRLHDLLCNALRSEAVDTGGRAAAIDALSSLGRHELALACVLAMPAVGVVLQQWLEHHGDALLHRDDVGPLAARVLDEDAGLPASVLLWCARAALATDLVLADNTAERAFEGFGAIASVDGQRLCCGVGLLSQSVLLDAKRFRLWQSRHAEISPPRQASLAVLLEGGCRLVEHVMQRSETTPELSEIHRSLHEALLGEQPPQEAILAASILVYSLLQMQRRQEIPAALAEMEAASWFKRAPAHSKVEWHINKGFTLVGLGRLEAAAVSFADAATLARQQHLPLLVRSALVGYGRTQLMIGRPGEAEAAVAEAEALDVDPGVHRRVDELIVRVGTDLARHRPIRALSGVETAERLLSDSKLAVTSSVERARVQVLYAMGRSADALAYADSCIDRNSSAARDLAECDRELLAATTLWSEDHDRAQQALVKAVGLIEQRRWTNFLLLLPREAGQVADRALRAAGGADVIRDAIRERRLPAPPDASPDWPWPLRIFLIGDWRLERFDEEIRFHGKVQRKPLELLKFLACSREQQADHSTVCSALWPDAEEYAARRSLEMATARLREVLGNADWIRVADGRTRLDPAYVWCDVQALLRSCAEAEALEHDDARVSSVRAVGDAMLALNKGALLPGEEESPWVLGTRERLRAAFVRGVRSVTNVLQRMGEREMEVKLLEGAFASEPLAEELAQRLMRAHVDRQQPAEAIRVYRHLRQMLSVLLGTKPSPASEQLGQSILLQQQERSHS